MQKTSPMNACSNDREILKWLLEEKDPSIRYRTLTELLDQSIPDAEYQGLKSSIAESRTVKRIFGKMESNGDWLVEGKHFIGTGPENIGPGFCISHLAELAVDKTNSLMNLAVDRLLSNLEGYSFGSYPCGDALWLRGVILAGYHHHPVVVQAIAELKENARWDGGFLCERPSFSSTNKSCLHGSQNMLLAYAEIPELWQTSKCIQLVNYFLERQVYFKRGDFSIKPKGDLRTIFPFNLRQGILEPLYALSKMGFGNQPEMKTIWRLLESKRTPEGAYTLDWTPPRSYLKGGKKGEPSKWVTFYALLSKKYRDSTTPPTRITPAA